MKKRSLHFLTLLSASFIATSCSLFSNLTFDWMKATNNNTEINYCLLIGQNEHSDSIERTRYTREALNTRDPSTEINGNANLGIPKQGEIELNAEDSIAYDYDPAYPTQKFKVNELEHMEQKSLAGVVWDGITANQTTSTWINKHSDKITMIISNNDGMAEGALNAYNYTKGLPIFGYDANTSTLRLIQQCEETGVGIMGTVDQNAGAQCAAAYMIIRNIIDDVKSGKATKDGKNYDPTNRGFSKANPNKDLGLYIDGFSSEQGEQIEHQGIVDPHKDEKSEHNLDLNYDDGYHEILSTSTGIGLDNVDDYVRDGKVLEPEDLAWDDELGFVHRIKNPKPNLNEYKVCHIYNNSAETFLQGPMYSYYSQYASAMGINDMKYDGDGVSEQTIFDRIKGALAANKFDAFLVNMVTTTDGQTFVAELSKAAAEYEGKKIPTNGWDKWEDRLNTPLIFWNKQPQLVTGEVDTGTMNNKFFKYTYFVGVDAAYGGKEQGKMIVSYLNERFKESVGKKK